MLYASCKLGEDLAMLPVVETEAPAVAAEARLPVGLASLPRLSTPSLQRHFWSWDKQGSGGGGLGGGSSRLGTAISNSELSQRRPHLITDRPPSAGPPADRRSNLQAEHDVSKILDTVRHSRSLGTLEVPHGMRLDRRVRGLDFLCSGTRSAAMMEAGKDKERLRAMAAAGLSENLDGRLKPKCKGKKNKESTRVGNSQDIGGSGGASPASQVSKDSDEDDEEATKRIMQERAASLMRSTEFFQALEVTSKGMISKLASKVTFRKEKKDQVIFRQNDPAGGAWVVMSGKVGVCIWKGSAYPDDQCPTPRTKHNPPLYLTLKEVEERKQQRLEVMKASVNIVSGDKADSELEEEEPPSPTGSMKARSRWLNAGKKAMNAQTLMQAQGKSWSKSSSKGSSTKDTPLSQLRRKEEKAAPQQEDKKGSHWKGSRSKIFSMVRMQGAKKQPAAAGSVQGDQHQQDTETEEAERREEASKTKKKKGFKAAVGKIMLGNRELKAAAAVAPASQVNEGGAASPVSEGADEPRSTASPTSPAVSRGSMADIVGHVLQQMESEKDDPEAQMRRMQEENGEGRYKTCEKYSTFTKESVLGNKVAELGPGSIFGELALQNSKLRAASIVCLEECEFIYISPDIYNKVLKQIMDRASTTSVAKDILRGTKFCKGLEASSPGITEELARECRIHKEKEQQVLFRQGDPPGDCYVVAEGSIEIFIFKEVDENGKKAKPKDYPTPRSDDDPRRLRTINQEFENFKRVCEVPQSRKSGVDFQVWAKGARYSTTEGNSAFGEASRYGDKIATLTRGAVVGELALQNNKPRAATVRCSSDCVFLLISKDVFQRVLGVLVEKMRFFNANLPGLSKLQYRENHPSILFQRRVFPAGYKFMFEGIFAIEPALFMLFVGAVEFRRFRNSTDNFAYLQGHKPLMDSKPLDKVLGDLSPKAPEVTSSQEDSTAQSPSSVSSPHQRHAIDDSHAEAEKFRARLKNARNKMLAEASGQGERDVAVRTPSRTQQLAGPSAWTRPSSRSSSQVTCEESGEAEVFCTMPFLPMAVSEPFTVVAVSNVEAYHIGGPDCDKLPHKLVMELRKHLLRKMDAKLRHWLEIRENFRIHRASSMGSQEEEETERRQASTWPSFWKPRSSDVDPGSNNLAAAFRASVAVEKTIGNNLGER